MTRKRIPVGVAEVDRDAGGVGGDGGVGGGDPRGCGRGDGTISTDGAPSAYEGFAPSFKGLEVEVDVLVTVDGEVLLGGCVIVV